MMVVDGRSLCGRRLTPSHMAIGPSLTTILELALKNKLRAAEAATNNGLHHSLFPDAVGHVMIAGEVPDSRVLQGTFAVA